MDKAKKLENTGENADEIFIKTGWFRGADNQWRYEIDNSEMKLDVYGLVKIKDNPDYKRYKKVSEKIFSFNGGKLECPTKNRSTNVP